MSRLHASFRLGYHGCSEEAGKAILTSKEMLPSRKSYNWLGSGRYFWDADPVRAWQWADENAGSGEAPFVIGAVIDLQNCLDLTVQEDLRTLKKAGEAYRKHHASINPGKPLPENRTTVRGDQRLTRADFDCAVIDFLHESLEERHKDNEGGEVFDTVRGFFFEGNALYDGSMFREKTHVQIAVVNPKCLVEIFQKDRPESMSS